MGAYIDTRIVDEFETELGVLEIGCVPEHKQIFEEAVRRLREDFDLLSGRLAEAGPLHAYVDWVVCENLQVVPASQATLSAVEKRGDVNGWYWRLPGELVEELGEDEASITSMLAGLVQVGALEVQVGELVGYRVVKQEPGILPAAA